MGVPKSEYEKIKTVVSSRDQEIAEFQKQVTKLSQEVKGQNESNAKLQAVVESLKKEKEQIQSYLRQKEDEVVELRQEIRRLKEDIQVKADSP